MTRSAIVTGGAQGMGFGIAEAFVREGYTVAIIDCDEEALLWTADRLGGNVHPFLCDIAEAAALERTIGKIIGECSSIDALVNNAAVATTKPLAELSLEEWNRTIAVNLTAQFLGAKLCAKALRASHGSIVNIASSRAMMSEPDTEAYTATKGGIVALTHALAMSLAPVRVNAISPGWIDVSALRKPSAQKQVTLSDADHRQHPAGRVGRTEDIAQMVLYLCSDKAGFITGQNFVIDGGMTKKMIYV